MSIVDLEVPKEVIYEHVDDFRGIFIIGPLEPGYGVTIGNSLRRVLLSSLPGYAITAVKIDEVTHEYSTIPGVLQDVVDIILNLKQVRLKKRVDSEIEDQKISISLKQKTAFYARDIEEFTHCFEVTNPDLLICNMNASVVLNMEFKVVFNKGYVPALEVELPKEDAGFLSIDGIFSPVKNISFSVEHARVGNRTDFEKLKLDLTTDGTITPQKALEKATKILMESFSIILKNSLSDFDASIFDTDIVTNEELHFRKLLKTQIKDIAELSTRSVNCLEGAGIYSLHDLLGKSLVEIKSIKSFGTKSYNEVKEVMAKYNLQNK